MLGESKLFKLAFALNMAARGCKLGPSVARFMYWVWERLWNAFLRVRQSLHGEWAEVNLAGGTIRLDLSDRSVTRALYVFREYEPSETALLARSLGPGMTFVDIGANTGYYSLLASSLVGEGGMIVAFEPAAENVRILHRNISANNLHNITVVECAIGSENGQTPLYLSEINSGDHRVYDGKDDDFYNIGKPRASRYVQVTSLDRYLQANGLRPDFIKMDIQGAEYLALLGMQGTLQEHHDVELLTEYWPHGLSRAGCDPKQFLTEFERLGFIIHTVSRGGEIVPGSSGLIGTSVVGKDSATLFLTRRSRTLG